MKLFTPKAKWIWCGSNQTPNDRVLFYKTFALDVPPAHCACYIAADTKYWLFVNNRLVVYEGGLFRESLPGCGYVDQVDLGPFLVSGQNEICALVWYYGNQGRNNIDSTQAGFLLECEPLKLFSGSSFLALRPAAFVASDGSQPSYLYGGYDTAYDARLEQFHVSPQLTLSLSGCVNQFSPAIEYPNQCWGELYERPIPPIRFGQKQAAPLRQTGPTGWQAQLPHAMTFSPYLEVNAQGGEKITLYTDRYLVNGGPGDTHHQYRGHKLQYICKKGRNCFLSLFYLYGEQVYVTADQPVELQEIGYLKTGYDADILGSFSCNCPVTNRLVEKAARTLYVCMRDNYMDCPDRERGQWIGDVSVQAAQTGYLLSPSAHQLTKKCIHDFIFLREGDVLMGNVPGTCRGELPSQSLNAISQLGLVAEYYRFTGDKEALDWVLEPAVRYLKLWHMEDNGLVGHREGGWGWFDHLYNIDKPVLENCWYYSALCFLQEVAVVVNQHAHDDFLQQRAASIAANFEHAFWRGGYYASDQTVDDRANAMAVLAGLCPKEHYPQIREVLLGVFNATTYMENYVLTALCRMGYIADAYHRMISRYYPLAVNENTTLWEDFFLLGTKNHAWSGAPATIAFRYFMGIRMENGPDHIKIAPCQGLFAHMTCTIPGKNGMIRLDYDDGTQTLTIHNTSQSQITVEGCRAVYAANE